MKIKLFTHDDLDGAACAVLLRLWVGDENIAVEHTANPQALTQRLESWVTSTERLCFDQTWVTDVSANADLLRQLPGLVLVDHHVTAQPLVTQLADLSVNVHTHLHGLQTCAAELVHELLLNSGTLSTSRRFFVELVRAYDTWDWVNSEYKLPAYLSALVYAVGVDEFERRFTARLANGDVNELTLFTETERTALAALQAKEDRECAFMAKQAKVVDCGGLRCAVLFATGNVSAIGHLVCTTMNADFALMVNAATGKVDLRTDGNAVDLSKLAAGAFNGGGHKRSAGGRLPAELTNSVLTEAVNLANTWLVNNKDWSGQQ